MLWLDLPQIFKVQYDHLQEQTMTELSKKLEMPTFVWVTLGACLWLIFVFLLQQLGNWETAWSILPRHLNNWRGFLLSSSLHGSWQHLSGNMLAILTLGLLMGHLYPKETLKALAVVWVVSFSFTWLLGAPGSAHMGASGIIYGLMAFAVVYPFFRREFKPMIGGLLVLIVFGGAVWGLLPQEGVSMAGHVGGALGGVVSALLMRPKKKNKDSEGQKRSFLVK